MPSFKIALMPGDGIGNDILTASQPLLDVLDLDAEYVHADIGWSHWCNEGEALPPKTGDILKGCRCALFGAITSKPTGEAEQELVPRLQGKGLIYRSPILTLRKMFDLYTNMRPCKSYPGNPNNHGDNIDITIFRENTEGLYSEIEFHPFPDELRAMVSRFNAAMDRFAAIPSQEMAVALRVITKRAASRIIRRAFEYAQNKGYRKVTLVEKANVLRETSGMMVREAHAIAADYPRIELQITYIDAQLMWLIKNPQDFSVMVTSNLFGDIMSDVASQLVGGLGFSASGNIGDKFAIFEPSHGSAPKYEGKFVVNPCAMLLSIKMMLDWLGEEKKASALESAIASVVKAGKVRTYDMGGKSSTLDMGRAIADRYVEVICGRR
ncbi:MAG: isocitrate/isopropylmalate dehydrogenase family protein [Deltaproteobacteria bacterium]|nr:isocitrate/isopropylmalate dehydrogenase family protein [Deltaproteobacteria bacterium]